jgi:AcrR family transcriptional regulator
MPDTTRARRHQNTRRSILDAARRIVYQQGVDALSMRAIAQQIDYSPAGLYDYFEGKDAILQTLCLEGHQRLSEHMRQALAEGSPNDRLLAIGLGYIEFAVNNPDYYLLMFATVPAQPDMKEFYSEASSYTILLQVIQEGIADGSFQPRPGYGVEEMAYSAWALVHGISMLRITYLKSVSLDFSRIDHETLRAFGRGLA